MTRIAPVLAALLFLPLAAQAEPTFCTARINGKDVPLAYDKDEPGLRDHFSRREILSAAWGRDTCPSYVVLRSLTPDLTDQERGPFCLRHDRASGSTIGYDLGRRDAHGRCEAPAKTVCQRVNQTRNAAVAITGAAARGAVKGAQALPDGSGAVILSGSQGYITGALSSIGGAAAAMASSPAIVAGAAVSVVAVGGAVYACRE